MELKEHKKEVIEDKEFLSHLEKESYSQKVLIKVFAKNINFIDINFKQSEFSRCYFRNCHFRRCNFTGASFRDTYLKGSEFEECQFIYTTWEKTALDDQFLDSCLPSEENLARDLCRNLRINYMQIGNYPAANKAASIEVKLTGAHLFNAAYSKQSYYRSKYKNIERINNALLHIRWKFLDLLWGNGESTTRILIFTLFLMLTASIYLLYINTSNSISSAFGNVFLQFWGIKGALQLPVGMVASLTISRFVLIGLFMTVLIKKMSRR